MNKNPQILYLLMAVPKQCSLVVAKNNEGMDSTKDTILLALLWNDGRCGYDRLTRMTLFTAGTISKQIKYLVDNGYVLCSIDDVSRKNKIVEITEKGRAYIEEAVDRYNEVESIGLLSFEPEQKEEFVDFLDKIYSIVNVDEEERQVHPDGFPVVLNYFSLMQRTLDYLITKSKSKHELKYSERLVILALYHENKTCTFKKLERFTVLSQPYLVKTIKGLEKQGLVECSVDEKDRRVMKATITEKGKEYSKPLYENCVESQEYACAEFTKEQREKLHYYLLLFSRNLFIEYGSN